MPSTTCDGQPRAPDALPVPARRRAGVLLHPTSLPGPLGVGDLGPEARLFAERLALAGQSVWQVLPLAPTGYGDSPYQALSAFAGNPLLVSLEDLRDEGWLAAEDLAALPRLPEGVADYEAAARLKLPLLSKAAERFARTASAPAQEELAAFHAREAGWLDDVALFLALKAHHGGRAWTSWAPALVRRDPAALAAARRELAGEIAAHVFTQWAFDRQWSRLRAHARALGLALMGDVPIYLAHDSAEVWARPGNFALGDDGRPSAVAGVPPDYFAATGQLWGNPLHDWAAQAKDGYRFWIDRMRANLRLYDLVRLDHFRGFEAYWAVPAGEPTAQNGRWVKGPGAAVFETVQAALGPLPIVAENLGVITPEVEALRHRFGWPGMAIAQFAFGDDPQAPTFLPHRYPRDVVAYTGTHDNDTVAGWWASEAGVGSTRTPEMVERERAKARAYLGTDGRDMPFTLLRWVYASQAELTIAPAQDLLGLGSEARMNTPGTASGNWRWRLAPGAFSEALARRVGALAALYDRSAGPVSSNQ